MGHKACSRLLGSRLRWMCTGPAMLACGETYDCASMGRPAQGVGEGGRRVRQWQFGAGERGSGQSGKRIRPGRGVGKLAWILTPDSSPTSITQATWIYAHKITGTDTNRPIGLASVQLGVGRLNSLLWVGTQPAPNLRYAGQSACLFQQA